MNECLINIFMLYHYTRIASAVVGWFQGLSKMFLTCAAAKLLLLAGYI